MLPALALRLSFTDHQLVKIGVIKPENKPGYDKIVDKSLYAEAMKRVVTKVGKLD